MVGQVFTFDADPALSAELEKVFGPMDAVVTPPLPGITLGQPITSSGANVIDAVDNGVVAGVNTAGQYVGQVIGNATGSAFSGLTPYLIMGGILAGVVLISRR